MTELDRLVAIEAIKQLKARYFNLVDTKQWARWRAEIWTDDAELNLPGSSTPCIGADAITMLSSEALGAVATIHRGHMPVITVLASDYATGVWAMEERHYAGDPASLRYHGWGHYDEEYALTEDGWRIARCTLSNLFVAKP